MYSLVVLEYTIYIIRLILIGIFDIYIFFFTKEV